MVLDFAMALRARRVSRAFEKRPPGPTDSQVVASSHKLNLRLKLCGQTDSQVSSQVQESRKKTHFEAGISRISSCADLGGGSNGEKVASTCVQIWSRPKWAQVIASQRKCTQGRELAFTCDSVWPGLNYQWLCTLYDWALISPTIISPADRMRKSFFVCIIDHEYNSRRFIL